MVTLGYAALVEGNQFKGTIRHFDTEHKNHHLRMVDSAINQRVARSLLEWDQAAAIAHTEEKLIKLIDSGGPNSVSEFTDCFESFLGFTPTSVLLGFQHLNERLLNRDPRFVEASHKHGEWLHLAMRAFEHVRRDSGLQTSREVVLEIHLENDPCIVVRKRTENLDNTEQDHGLANIVVWKQNPF